MPSQVYKTLTQVHTPEIFARIRTAYPVQVFANSTCEISTSWKANPTQHILEYRIKFRNALNQDWQDKVTSGNDLHKQSIVGFFDASTRMALGSVILKLMRNLNIHWDIKTNTIVVTWELHYYA
jgi:hypothetical protein